VASAVRLSLLPRASARVACAKAHEPGSASGCDRSVRGTIASLAPWEDNAHARSSRRRGYEDEVSGDGPPKRFQGRETEDPLISRVEPKLHGTSAQRKLRQ